MSGDLSLSPINIDKIFVFSDSSVALNWINLYCNKNEKMNRKPTFVMNRLNNIVTLCDIMPVTFLFVSGEENPADCVTRCLPHRQLSQILSKDLNFYVKILIINLMSTLLSFTVPSTFDESEFCIYSKSSSDCLKIDNDQLISLNKFSNLNRLIRVYRLV